MNILDLLAQSGIAAKRVSSTHGGEYASACPLCGGGTDRFRAWPERGSGGRWWCRQCGRGGDLIQYLRDVRGMSYLEARCFLDKEPSNGRRSGNPEAREWTPKTAALPGDQWREKADAFMTWAQGILAETPDVIEWLRDERGLSGETVRTARLGLNSKDFFLDRAAWGLTGDKKVWLPAGLVIPTFTEDGRVLRLKIRRPGKEDPRYVFISGGSTGTMILDGGAGCYVVVESELDGLLLQQEARDLCCVVILGSASARPDEATTARLNSAEVLLVALDADAAGAKQAWTWWTRNFPMARRWPPVRGKDITDMWRVGVSARSWVVAGIKGEM